LLEALLILNIQRKKTIIFFYLLLQHQKNDRIKAFLKKRCIFFKKIKKRNKFWWKTKML